MLPGERTTTLLEHGWSEFGGILMVIVFGWSSTKTQLWVDEARVPQKGRHLCTSSMALGTFVVALGCYPDERRVNNSETVP